MRTKLGEEIILVAFFFLSIVFHLTFVGISDVVLEKAFGLGEKAVDHIKFKFTP
jgi:hypothetical protein